jgi:hypothetical protein
MISIIPVFTYAIVLFLVGYLLAKLLSTILFKTLKKVKFDDLSAKLKLEEPLRIIGANKGLSMLVANIVFWLIMMAVTVSTTRNLGIDVLSKLVQDIIAFIPKIFISVLILLAGYLIATKIKEVLINVTTSLGGSAGSLLGSIMYYFIMVIVVITSIEQLGVNTDLISNNILIVVAVILFAGAVAYGYAAREIMRNMLSSFYSKKNFYSGQRIRIGDLEGEILKIDNTSVVIQTVKNKMIIPSSELMVNHVEVLDSQV